MVEIVTTRLSFVFINLKDPSIAPSIFESLNDAGVRITVSNLVRNEIFSRVSESPEKAIQVFHSKWEPFQGKFRERFEDFFFPYGLTVDPNVKKATLFEQLRKRWGAESSPEEIIDDLDDAGNDFLWAATTLWKPQDTPVEIDKRFHRLRELGAPAATYPFLMQLARAVREDYGRANRFIKTLDIVESFLVRRAMCGIEPTGLHAVFKGLWRDSCGEPEAVIESIKGKTTVPWPEDKEFFSAAYEGELYGKKGCKYVLFEYERSLDADLPENEPEIEHVMPVHISSSWKIPAKTHQKWLDTWANLVVVSPGLNRSLKNGPFEDKRIRYAKESMFASPREIAGDFYDWNEESLKDRAKRLAEWAKERWRY